MAELGSSQISALLESVPGIANVLRSPVADALVNMIRAGAGAGKFKIDDARELVQYAVRRGLIGRSEGDELLEEVGSRKKKKPAERAARSPKPAGRSAAVKPTTRKTASKPAKPAARAAKKKSAAKAVKKKAVKRAAKKSTARTRVAKKAARKKTAKKKVTARKTSTKKAARSRKR